MTVGSAEWTEGVLAGEIFPASGEIELRGSGAARELTVVNTGDRPVQVGSHFHFAETNPALAFDRQLARGCHLLIAAGTSVRFEPGVPRVVVVTPFGGARIAAGFRGEVAGPLGAA